MLSNNSNNSSSLQVIYVATDESHVCEVPVGRCLAPLRVHRTTLFCYHWAGVGVLQLARRCSWFCSCKCDVVNFMNKLSCVNANCSGSEISSYERVLLPFNPNYFVPTCAMLLCIKIHRISA